MRAALGVLLATLAAGPGRADPLGATLFVSPVVVSEGQAGVITANVYNGEACELIDVVPLPAPQTGCGLPDTLRWDASSGSVMITSGPAPSCTADLTSGQHAFFSWAFTASLTGSVTFSLTCAGQETGGGGCTAAPTELAFVSLTIQRPPILVATLHVDSGVVPYLGTVTVYMDVTNYGDATANSVRPFRPVVTGTGTLAPAACPPLALLCGSAVPPVYWTLSGGGTTTTYVWSYQATAPGPLTISGSFTGTDNNSGVVKISALSVLPLSVGAPNVLSLTVTGWSTLLVGQTLTLDVDAMNVSATELSQSAFRILLDGQPGWFDVVAVRFPLPRQYDPGQVRSFTVTVRVHDDAPLGVHQLQVQAVGTDVLRGLPVVSAGGTVVLPIVAAVSGFSQKPAFVPNPYRAKLGGGVTVTWTVAPPQAGPVSVRILTLTGDTVRTIAEGTQTAGVYSSTWDGRNASGQEVASGVYLVHFEAQGASDVRKLAVIR